MSGMSYEYTKGLGYDASRKALVVIITGSDITLSTELGGGTIGISGSSVTLGVDTKGLYQTIGTSVDKVSYAYDGSGNISTLKYYENTGSTLLFTLTYAYSGSYIISITKT